MSTKFDISVLQTDLKKTQTKNIGEGLEGFIEPLSEEGFERFNVLIASLRCKVRVTECFSSEHCLKLS